MGSPSSELLKFVQRQNALAAPPLTKTAHRKNRIIGTHVNSSYAYGSSITYRDIPSGDNGASALSGYDLVTGRAAG
jgi:hypothetical protein